MAKVLVFDLETDGLSTASSCVLEFAYMLWDSDTGSTESDVMYFNIDHEVPFAASRVNGLTRTKLAALSSGLYFDERMDEIRGVFHKAGVLVGHNAEEFDIPMIMSNFRKYGSSLSRSVEGRERIWKTYDTMVHAKDVVPRAQHKGHHTGNRKYYGPKLTTAYAWICNNVYKKNPSDMDGIFNATYSTQGSAHEALYDVWMTFVLYKGLLAMKV